MPNAYAQYSQYSRRRRRRAERVGKRLDIQGLRMVAVLTVFANHLWGWPDGGFIGVDVFFVISGFLITSNLLHTAESKGNVSFKDFYWNRVRRIVPAATVVLIFTCIAAYAIFVPFRAREVGVDALWAFAFMSNWWFGIKDTDYFTAAAGTISPLQHYWSLSIEEQFYFIWPALIFVISIVVLRKNWGHQKRLRLAAATMAAIITASFAWALYQTAAAPAWAYFDTFARVWELGVGALLACAGEILRRLPDVMRPLLSWAGLGLIAVGLFVISESASGFPAPWALVPVAGAALVIAAGVGAEPRFQPFLRNPVAGYIGDISYSLYLVHWPVIVLLGSLMDAGIHFSVTVLALGFGLAIASYHIVENPLRKADLPKFRQAVFEIRRRRYQPDRSTGYAAVAAVTLTVVALVSYIARPEAYEQATPPPLAVAAPQEVDPSGIKANLGPLATELQREITAALQATEWPALDPTLESVMNDPSVGRVNMPGCGGIVQQNACTWGEPTAPIRVLVVGNSVAVYYAETLREIALNSGGQIQLHTEAMPGCNFVDDLVANEDPEYVAACPGRKDAVVDLINTTKPSVVVISNNYNNKRLAGSDRDLTPGEWTASMGRLIDKFRANTKQVVLLAPPPGNVLLNECYGGRGALPADCVGTVAPVWLQMARAEREFARSVGGEWIDSRPWFCSPSGYCPSFVGTTPTKVDRSHMVPAYGLKIHRVVAESLRAANVFP